MNINDLREEIKLRLTGDVLNLEIDDGTVDKVINSALREVQRYISTTNLVTIPYSTCIDFNKVKEPVTNLPIKVNSIFKVYRTKGYNSSNDTTDPMYLAQWQLMGGLGNYYNINDYTYNYMAHNTLLQIKNTLSTDLSFKYDRPSNKLYINSTSGTPENITIEYIPRYDSVEEIYSDYWIDIIIRMSVAMTKIVVGRIRSRFTQANALWTQDGASILEEGTNELKELREHLVANTQLLFPVD